MLELKPDTGIVQCVSESSSVHMSSPSSGCYPRPPPPNHDRLGRLAAGISPESSGTHQRGPDSSGQDFARSEQTTERMWVGKQHRTQLSVVLEKIKISSFGIQPLPKSWA